MPSQLENLVQSIPEFNSWIHAEKIRFFAWVLHSAEKKDRFTTRDIRRCFSNLHIEPPSSIAPFLTAMEKAKPKQVLKDKGGYYLERRVRDDYERRYGLAATTVSVRQLVLELPDKVPDLAEKDFLNEAIICLTHGAKRAAVVMTWNLTYFHLLQYTLGHKLAEFNAAYPKRYAGIHKKAKVPTIARYEDFAVDLQESEVIEIAKTGVVITQEQFKSLDRGLDRRNTAAHPNLVVFTDLQAEEVIHDLIANVVLALPL